MIKTVPFLQQSSGNKKALKNTTISYLNRGSGDNWLLENGADVLRLTGMGLARDEGTRVEQQARKRGGVIMSIITDVIGGVAKTAMMCIVAIRRDGIAVVSMRGTVDGRSLITSSARSRAWPCNN